MAVPLYDRNSDKTLSVKDSYITNHGNCKEAQPTGICLYVVAPCCYLLKGKHPRVFISTTSCCQLPPSPPMQLHATINTIPWYMSNIGNCIQLNIGR